MAHPLIRVFCSLCIARPRSCGTDLARPRRPCLRDVRSPMPPLPAPTPLVARGTDSAGTARRCHVPPPPGLAPPIASVLHPLVAATAEVRATIEFRTGDLRVLCGIMLRTGVELRKDELCSSKQQGDIALKNACCKLMFQVFQMYVASVLYGRCKSRSGCCICRNGCTLMSQMSVLNVSSVF
jgi:hypothetical protein